MEEPRSKSDFNEEDLVQKNEENDGQEDNQNQDEIQVEFGDQNQNEVENKIENQSEDQVNEENQTKDENEVNENNEINEENNLNETDNQNENSLDESNTELNVSENQENNEKENESKDGDEQVYVHKTVKRKARQTNKFADGNLILEEEIDEVNIFLKIKKSSGKSKKYSKIRYIFRLSDKKEDKRVNYSGILKIF